MQPAGALVLGIPQSVSGTGVAFRTRSRRDGLEVILRVYHHRALPEVIHRPPHPKNRPLLRSHHRLLRELIVGCREHTHDFSGGWRGSKSEALPIPLSAVASTVCLVFASADPEKVGV